LVIEIKVLCEIHKSTKLFKTDIQQQKDTAIELGNGNQNSYSLAADNTSKYNFFAKPQ
jgi:hypothetical protein